ncbi:dihydrofolate reductase family protein [Nonomuraea sediminis]|uniref:dihydrofolate reductase family protein n=1 Tax=Nonomuraea sediminis TaxID=2835864 RepID=UPI001BDBB946|nr:dihydrofolate reductase family protein [Nonomuraea sediminis]
MRKLIAGMKTSLDGKVEGPEGYADWVPAWSEDYDLTPQVDAVVIGGNMYPGYEQYWTTIKDQQDAPHPLTGRTPTPGELEWSRFAAQTPHYVLSTTLTSAEWPQTRFLTKAEEIAALKQQPGKDIYLMGGARITASLIDAGLVDELRLIVYPLIAGEGKPLFGTIEHRHALDLQKVQQLPNGLLALVYTVG